MSINFDKAMALHQASVSDIGVKEVADYLNKGISTLYAEIRQEHGYKLGMIDFFKVSYHYGNIDSLKSIMADMGYCLYQLPDPTSFKETVGTSVLRALAMANKECSEGFAITLRALADGKITKKEAREASAEYQEAIDVLVQIKSMMDNIWKV